MIRVTLFWNYRKCGEVKSEKKNIRNEIMSRVAVKCQQENVTQYQYEKFSCNTNRYTFTELKNIVDGDKINVKTEQKTSTTENEHLTAMKVISRRDYDGFKEQLMEKIKVNDHLTDADRKYVFHFIKFHESCSGTSICESSVNQAKRVTNGNDDENCSPRKKIKTVDTGSQCSEKAFGDGSVRSEKKKTTTTVHTASQCFVRKSINAGTQCFEKSFSSGSKSNEKKRVETRDVGTQCVIQFVNNYDHIKKFLRDYPNLPPEQQDPEKFKDCSRLLFDDRRAFMMNSIPTAQVFKECHPYMFNYEQVVIEFELIAQKTDMFDTFKNNVKKYSKVTLAENISSHSRNRIMREIQASSSSKERLWLEMTGSLLLLPELLRNDRRGIILCTNEEPIQELKYPYIRHMGDCGSCLKKHKSFKILVEGIELCETNNLLKAVFALVATYYIFNAVYPDSCFFTFNFLEHLYIEHTDEFQEQQPEVRQLIRRFTR